MHRVRHLLPYFKQLGWDAEVIAVDPKYIESYSIDLLLLKTIPADTKVHFVKAWDVNKTRKLGLGSLSIRSYFYFKKKGNEILMQKKIDLIYFTTTMFHVMALGPYWKKKFGVPFILDIQDPWRKDFQLDKPKSERSPKFWINYKLDSYLERKTIPNADGIISVSQGYCDVFKKRYPTMKHENCMVIPFAGSALDFELMEKEISSSTVTLPNDKTNILYIGRGGHDLKKACRVFFKAIKKGVEENIETFKNVHITFLGTSYAVKGSGLQTILPVAVECGIEKQVTEIPDRIPYFESLNILKQADILFVPGSTDRNYTASKIFPYILAKKPLLAIFDSTSSVADILKKTKYGICLQLDSENEEALLEECKQQLNALLSNTKKGVSYSTEGFYQFTAAAMAKQHIDFFELVLNNNKI